MRDTKNQVLLWNGTLRHILTKINDWAILANAITRSSCHCLAYAAQFTVHTLWVANS